ncbi:MAG: hypothetical protein EOP84_25970, partial [Verrucomicrobiaceae bacterium]
MKRVFGIETEYGITVDGMEALDVVRESIETAVPSTVNLPPTRSMPSTVPRSSVADSTRVAVPFFRS